MHRRALVGAAELLELVRLLLGRLFVADRDHLVVVDDDLVSGYFGDDTGGLGEQHFTRVDRGTCFETRTYVRSFGHDQRNGLALHVCTHQCTLRVVVLYEGNQRRRQRDVLNWGDVDCVDLVAVNECELGHGRTEADFSLLVVRNTRTWSTGTNQNLVGLDTTVGLEFGFGSGNLQVRLGLEIDPAVLVGDNTVLHQTNW